MICPVSSLSGASRPQMERVLFKALAAVAEGRFHRSPPGIRGQEGLANQDPV
jgi:hypothetical protein